MDPLTKDDLKAIAEWTASNAVTVSPPGAETPDVQRISTYTAKGREMARNRAARLKYEAGRDADDAHGEFLRSLRPGRGVSEPIDGPAVDVVIKGGVQPPTPKARCGQW